VKELKSITSLAGVFEKLPGVGKKTALRYAFSIVEKFDSDDVTEFAQALFECKNKIRHCPICGMLTDEEKCEICSDSGRDHSRIIVIRDTKDVYSIEKTNQYHGFYHVLNGLISPLDGIGPDDINIQSLEKRIQEGNVREIIIATSFTPSGETTAMYLSRILKRDNLEISRIGYGIPAGGDIEYVDELTLQKALEAKQKI
jgi:recombination protein RecR